MEDNDNSKNMNLNAGEKIKFKNLEIFTEKKHS